MESPPSEQKLPTILDSEEAGENVFYHEDQDQEEESEEELMVDEPPKLSQDQFVSFCRMRLLSNIVIEDGRISQHEVADFIQEVCTIFDPEEIPKFQCPNPKFPNLDIDVQLAFVWYICPNEDPADLVGCLAELGVSGREFGYPIDLNNFDTVDSEIVSGFCCSLFPFMDSANMRPLQGMIQKKF